MLFLMMSGIAFAQPVEGKFYRIKDNGTSKYLTIESYNANSTGSKGTVPVLDEATDNADQVWEFESTGTENEYKIKSKSGYYVTLRKWNVDATSEGTAITIEEAADVFSLKWASTYYSNAFMYIMVGADNGGAGLFPYCDAAEGDKASWSLVEVSEAELARIDALLHAASILAEVRGIIADTKRVGTEAYTDVTALQTALSAYESEQSADNLTALQTELNNLKADGTKATVTLSAGEKFRVQCFDTGRGWMAYSTAEGKAHETNVMLAGTQNNAGWAEKYPALDAEGVYADWAIVEVEGGKYIYNVQKQQCITYGGANGKVTFSDGGSAITYAPYEASAPTVFEITFVGGQHLSFSPGYAVNDGGVRTWSGTDGGTKFYIEKVGTSVDEAMQTAMTNKIRGVVVDKFDAMKALTKFDILEGSTVVGPSEFANPTQINADIDAVLAVADNFDAKKAFVASEAGQRLQLYIDKVKQYGALANIQFTMKAEYGTLILPCPSDPVTGLKRKLLADSDIDANGVINLDNLEQAKLEYDKPYLIQAAEGSKFTIIGWDKGSTGVHTNGLLTGALNENTYVPAGSYILSKYNDKLGFYKVAEDNVYKAAKNLCYLTLPAAESRFEALFFESGTETGINSVTEGQSKQGGIYNIAGQRLSKLQKGLNIVNGKKIIVK